MDFSVLGPVRAWQGDRSIELGGRHRRCVLAVLLLQPNQVVSLDRMVELIWGEHPPSAVHNAIQTHVSRLRKAFGTGEVRIEAHPPGYILHVPPESVDLHRFRARVAEAGRTREPEKAGKLLHQALAEWQGRALADVIGSDAMQRLGAGLEEERLSVVQQRISADLQNRRHTEVVAELAELVGRYPLRESLAELWVLALYRCGRQADALVELQRIRARIVAELGVEPGPALQALRQRILTADPELDPPEAQPPAKPVPVPAQLPADVAGFCGRVAELAELDTLLDGTTIAALSGTAGVGKTALAVHWAHRVRAAFPDGQLYVNLRGYDPRTPMSTGDALTGFLEALGVAGPDVPVDTEVRAARFRTEVADRRMLIVLDNASSVEQVRALLPGTASCVVVVTSRDSLGGLVALHGARRIEVDLLSREDANALLGKLIGERTVADPLGTNELAEQCARLPLALRIAAELAISRRDAPIARLTEELRDGQRRLRLLDAGGDLRAAVRAVLSWSYRHLPDAAARLFRLLSCHPGHDVDPKAAAALAGVEVDEANRLLDLLTRASMIQRGGHGRYGQHDLLRAYSTELCAANDSGSDQAAARERLFDYYLDAVAAAVEVLFPVDRSAPPAGNQTEWLDVERPNLVAIAAYTAANGWARYAVRLAAILYRYLESGHYADALTIHTHGLRAAMELGDPEGEAHARTNLGLVRRLLGQYGPATEQLLAALELHRRTGDRGGEARTRSNLGIVEDRLGRHESAGEHFDAALARYRELENRHGTAAVLTNLGSLHNGVGRHSLAAENLEEALTLFRQLGDRGGAASALCNLGDAEIQLGHLDDAAKHLEEALALFQDMSHRYGQATAASNLGPLYSRLGQHDQAIGQLEEALQLFRDTGHRYGEASVLNGLGDALRVAGRAGALAAHLAALRIATETGDWDEQANAHSGAARVHLSLGELSEARHHGEQALTLNSPDAEEILARLAEMER